MIKTSKFIRRILALLLGNQVISKKYKDTEYKLSYKAAQHLIFLFKREVIYEQIVQQHLKKYIHEGDLIFDIGANIGQYTLFFAHLVGRNGKVISYEPDHYNFSFLNLNVQNNSLTQVITREVGVGKNIDELIFYIDTQTSRTSTFKQEFISVYNEKNNEVSNVRVTTIDHEISKYGIPQLIKIDTEGYEEEIILGYTRQDDNIKFLVEVRENSKRKVFQYFVALGYLCKCLDDELELIINDEESIPSFANLFFYK